MNDLWQHLDTEEFAWRIPDQFNLGRSAADDQEANDLALIVDNGVDNVRRYSFGDLTELSDRMMTVLSQRGIRRGDRVGVMVPQGVEVAVTHLACYKLGAVAVPLSVQFGPDAITYRLRHAAARLLVIFQEGFERLRPALDELHELSELLVVGLSKVEARATDFAEALAGAQPSSSLTDTMAGDPALLIYTSGTTGTPKGVLHGHRVALAQMPGFRLSHEGFPQPGDVFWAPVDWAWGGGLFDALLPTLLCGQPIVASPCKFDVTWAYELITRHSVRNCFLPPTALKQMRRAGPPRSSIRLRTVASGGEPLGEAMLSWAREQFGVVVNEFYGQTEANLLAGNSAGRWPIRPGSLGKQYRGSELAIVDSGGVPVSDGERGEVALALPHPGLFLRYWDDPDRTAEKMHGDWFLTGDLASRDTEGYIYFCGRVDDIISSGGYRIGPSEIEECLIDHPEVAMAGVIGIPDELRGEVVTAFVALADPSRASPTMTKELQDHVKHRLAFYQYPRTIHFVEEMPMTTTGKIQRSELRRRAGEG